MRINSPIVPTIEATRTDLFRLLEEASPVPLAKSVGSGPSVQIFVPGGGVEVVFALVVVGVLGDELLDAEVDVVVLGSDDVLGIGSVSDGVSVNESSIEEGSFVSVSVGSSNMDSVSVARLKVSIARL